MAKIIFVMILMSGYFAGLQLFTQRAQQELSSIQALYTASSSYEGGISSVAAVHNPQSEEQTNNTK